MSIKTQILDVRRARSIRAVLISVATTALVNGFCEFASAQSFVPVYPSTATMDVSFTYQIQELERDINNSSNYANNMLDHRRIFANRNIQNIAISGSGYMENNYDSLQYGWNDQTYSSATGTLASSTWLGQANRPGAPWPYMQTVGYVVRTFADHIVSSTGYNFTTLRAFRYSSPQPIDSLTAKLIPFDRNQVVMLGMNDVVHLRMLAQYHDSTIVTWPGNSTGAYGKIFARCGAPPTQTAFDFAATRTTGANVLFLPASACPAISSDWYIAIVSPVSNKGVVNVVTHTRQTTNYLNDILVDVEGFPIPTATHTAVLNLLRKAAWQQFGMSEGIVPIRNFHVRFLGNCYSGLFPISRPYVCLRTGSGRSNALGDDVELFGNCNGDFTSCPGWDSRVLAHEFMHLSSGADLPDEYIDLSCGGHSYIQCGHTAMATNFFNLNSVCVSSNHADDKESGLTCANMPVPSSSGPSAWERMAFYLLASPVPAASWTPDNYDYLSWFWSNADVFTIGRIADVIN